MLTPKMNLGPATALLTTWKWKFEQEGLHEYQFMNLDNATALEKKMLHGMLFTDMDSDSTMTTQEAFPLTCIKPEPGQRRIRMETSPPTDSECWETSDKDTNCTYTFYSTTHTHVNLSVSSNSNGRSHSRSRTRRGRSASAGSGAIGARARTAWTGFGPQMEWDMDNDKGADDGVAGTSPAQNEGIDAGEGEVQGESQIYDGFNNFEFGVGGIGVDVADCDYAYADDPRSFVQPMMNQDEGQDHGHDEGDAHFEQGNGEQNGTTASSSAIPIPMANYHQIYPYPNTPNSLEVPIAPWLWYSQFPPNPYPGTSAYSCSPGSVFYSASETYQQSPGYIMTPVSGNTPESFDSFGFEGYWNSQPQPAYQYSPDQVVYAQAPASAPIPVPDESFPGTFFPFPPLPLPQPNNYGMSFGSFGEAGAGNGYVTTPTPTTPGSGRFSFMSGSGARVDGAGLTASQRKKRRYLNKKRERVMSASESFGSGNANIIAQDDQIEKAPIQAFASAPPMRHPNNEPPRGKTNYCHFCWKNKETYGVYSTHALRNASGELTCPVLMRFTCPICNGTGVNAHTESYCPNRNANGNEAEPIFLTRKGVLATVGRNPFRN